MHPSTLFGACIAVLASTLPSTLAQTYSQCNPLQKTCPANPAVGNVATDFTKVSSLPSGWAMTSGALTYGSDGARFTVAKQGDSPTVQTSGYFFFGYAEVTMKAASGTGIVSSIVLESDDLDEVDWEWIGGNNGQVQTNYFGKGDTSTYDRAIWHPIATPQNTFHTYAVNWTTSAITWLIDGVVIRQLNYADAKGGSRFPQTPMRLKVGIWAGGDPNNGEGTITWAGGKTDFSKAPFSMVVSSMKVVNYSPGSSYTYGDNSGSWQSIKVAGGGAVSGGGSGSTGGSNTVVASGSAQSTTLTTKSVASGTAIFQISTATQPLSTSTAGAYTTSAPPIIPLLGSTTVSQGTANATRPSSTSTTQRAPTQTASSAPSLKADTSSFARFWAILAACVFAGMVM